MVLGGVDGCCGDVVSSKSAGDQLHEQCGETKMEMLMASLARFHIYVVPYGSDLTCSRRAGAQAL